MNTGDSFLKTLERLGYQEVGFLDEYDFNSITSQKELKSFFEVFCMLNEKNVLTTEEIEEYSALSPAELAEIEILMKNGQFEKSDLKYEKRREVLFLQEQLAHMEKHNKSVERQLEIFKKHEDALLEEKENHQSLLLNAKKRFQTYERNKIPQTEEEFVSNMESILKVAEDLEFLMKHTNASENKLPSSNFFKDVVQQYLNVEGKVLRCVATYLQNNFELQDYTLSLINDENSCRKELMKETFFLQKNLKNNMYHKAISEKDAKKLEGAVKCLEAVQVSSLNCHSLHLRKKLEDSLKLNEQLKKKEVELEGYAHDAVSKYVDALLTEVHLCMSNETCSNFQFFIEKMSLPMDTLLHQRARIEVLIALLFEHKKDLQGLKELFQKVLNQLNQEQSYLQERKVLIENEMADVVQQKNEQYPESVVLSSLYKILDDSETLDISKVTITDIIQKTNKFFEAKENFKRKHEENMETIECVEKYADSVKSLLNCTDKEYSDWHELDQKINVSLNNLGIKLTSLEGSLAECSEDLEQKQKLLEKKGNLRLARSLYIYALKNKELFKKCIDDIKVAVENSEGYKS